jgi:hypothetical protein
LRRREGIQEGGLASGQRRHDTLDECRALLSRQRWPRGRSIWAIGVGKIEQRRTHHFSPGGFPS